ncbi:cache domain-containing protein [Woodsholea maritima]|uniref:cache domain-containing protein n=1 Tax=Woodsholea maritima TaxID=240237 RepID=UPI000366DE34|nr:cache domain-containing protein [Woodsholea maritima]
MTRKTIQIWLCVVIGGLVIALLSGVATYRYLQTHSRDVTRDQLQTYIAERGDVEQFLFTSVARLHEASHNLYRRIYSKLSEDEAVRRFNTLFPLQEDGTRRSVDQLFDGITTLEGSPVYGIGAYYREGQALSCEDKRRLFAGYLTVRQIGPAYETQFSNFQFYDEHNNLILFAPLRPDRLMFYRKTAPNNLDFTQEPQVIGSLPPNNPTEQTRCTPVTVLLYRPNDPASHVGCYTPMRLGGRHMGAFGVSLNVSRYLSHAVSRPPENGENFILDNEGSLVVHSELLTPGENDEETLHVLQARLDGAEIARAVNANGRVSGVLELSDGDLIAFSRIGAPNWIFVSRIDNTTSNADPLLQAAFWAGVVFLLVLSQGPGLVSLLAERSITIDDIDRAENYPDAPDARELVGASRSAASDQSRENARGDAGGSEQARDPRTG